MNHFRPGSLFPSLFAATLIAVASVSLAAAAGNKKNNLLDKPINRLNRGGDIEVAADSRLADCQKELGQLRQELGTTQVILARTRQVHERESKAMADRLDEMGTAMGKLKAETEQKDKASMSLRARVEELDKIEHTLREQLRLVSDERGSLLAEAGTTRLRLADLARQLESARLVLEIERENYREEGLIRAGKALREQVRDRNNTALIWSLNDVGLLYLAEGRLDEAEGFFQRALLILSGQLPQERAAAGTLLQHLANTTWQRNNLELAASLYQQAATAFAESVGEGHSRYAAVLNGQAGVLNAMGEAGKAEELYRKALSIYEAQKPVQPVEVATPAHNLGLLYLDQGRLAEAGPMLKKAITALGDRPKQHAERALIMIRSMIRYCQQAGDVEMATLYQAKANDLMLSAMTP